MNFFHLLNMLKIKCDINQQYLKQLTSILSNLNNFHSLEVVDRVSGTQLQVGENSDEIILAVKGLKHIFFTSLKVDLMFLQPRVLDENVHESGLPMHDIFL